MKIWLCFGCKYRRLPIMVKASFWFLFASFFQKGISVLTTPVFTRLLSTEEYGQYTVFNSWLDVFSVIIVLKMYAGVFSSSIVKYEPDKERYTASVQGLTATLVLIWLFIYTLKKDRINEILSLSTIQVYAMLGIIWTTAVFSFWAVEQRVDQKYRLLVIVTIIISILKPVTGILAVCVAEDKVTARIVTIALVQMVVYAGFFFRDIYIGKTFFDKRYWEYTLLFCIPLLPHYISVTIMNSSDRIMIQQMAGESEAGIYGLAYSIAMLMILLNDALLQTMEPWIFKKIKTNCMEVIEETIFIALTMIAVINIIFILVSPEIMRVFAPSTYWEGRWIIPPVAMSQYFQFLYSTFALFQFYYEKNFLIAAISSIGAILNVGLNYIFIPKLGYVAAGYTTLFSIAVYAVVHYFTMQRICMKEYGTRVFSIKHTMIHMMMFLGTGVAAAMTYYSIALRWGMIVTIICAIFVYRKKLLELVKTLMRAREG